jgi:hypothetical protein
MGQVPPKYMLPSAPYGQSSAVNALNTVQPAPVNPQTPLLPPNFNDPGTTVGTSLGGTRKPIAPIKTDDPLRNLFAR